MRNNAGLSVTSSLDLFLLPFGLPRLRFPAILDVAFFASFLALLAAFSSTLRTTCVTCSGRNALLEHSPTKRRRMIDQISPAVGCQRRTDPIHGFLCLLCSPQLHHRQQSIHHLVAKTSAERVTSGSLSKASYCNNAVGSFGSCRLFLSSAIDPAS